MKISSAHRSRFVDDSRCFVHPSVASRWVAYPHVASIATLRSRLGRALHAALPLILSLLATIFVSVLAWADCEEYSDYLHSVGFLELPCGYYCAAMAGHHLVVGGNSRLTLVDVSDPQAPRRVGDAPTANLNVGVAVSGDYAYVASLLSGLQIVKLNLGKPGRPRIVGTIDLGGDVLGVAVSRRYAYVAGPGFHVVDVRNPEAPLQVGSLPLEGARCVAISGDYAYVCGPGFNIIDISEPNDPRIVSRITASWTKSVAFCGDHFVCLVGWGFTMIDVSDPHAPRIVGETQLDGCPEYFGSVVGVSGKHAYVASRQLQVVDISDPTHPEVVAGEHTFGRLCGVAVSGNYAYTAMGGGAADGGIQAFDVTYPENPPILGSVDIPDCAYAVVVQGALAYVGGDGGLQIVDNADPSNPHLLGDLQTSAYSDLALSGTRACGVGWLGNETGFQLIDVTDPNDPRDAGTIAIQRVTCVAASGSYAYVAGWLDCGFSVIDISHPGTPRIVGSIRMHGFERTGIAVSGDHAFVSSDIGLQVINIQDPSRPRRVGVLDTGSSSDVVVLGSLAYVYGDSRLQVVDIENPEAPRILGSVPLLGYNSLVAVSSPYVYVVRREWWVGLIQVIDVSDPWNPRFVGSIDTGQAWCVGASDSFVCGAGYQYQNIAPQCAPLDAKKSDQSPAWSFLSVFPCPASSSDGVTIRFDSRATEAPMRVGVFDTAGRLIRELSVVHEGRRELLWNGRDERGRAVPAGVYWARVLERGTAEPAVRLVIVR